MGGRRSSQCGRSPARSFPGRRAGESGENGQPAAAFLSVQLVGGRRSRSVGEGRSSAASAAHSRPAGEGIDSPGKRGRGAYGRGAGDHGSLAGQPERGAPGARTACPLGSSRLFHFKACLRSAGGASRGRYGCAQSGRDKATAGQTPVPIWEGIVDIGKIAGARLAPIVYNSAQ